MRPDTKQEKTYDEESTRPTTAHINKTKTQKEKVERPTGKGNPSNPEPERQNTIPKERPIHKSTVSSPAVKTIQRPTTREGTPIIQQKPVKSIRNKNTTTITTTKRNGDKS